jgi:predicted DNA-binding transcriptional regulator YafY
VARLARLLRILATVIATPGLHPARLAAAVGTSERTLYRDLDHLRQIGFDVIHADGYRLQEELALGPEVRPSPQGLADAYGELRRPVQAEAPSTFGDQLEAEVAALAPAALAHLFAEAVERRLALPNRARRRSQARPRSQGARHSPRTVSGQTEAPA